MRIALVLLALLALAGCETTADDDDLGGECTNFSGHAFPEVAIESPSDGTAYTDGDVLNFVVSVSDADTDLADLSLVAEDTIDNSAELIDVDVPTPDASGESRFSIAYDDLGQGTHTVRVRAVDPTGCRGDDSVVVCLDDPGICD